MLCQRKRYRTHPDVMELCQTFETQANNGIRQESTISLWGRSCIGWEAILLSKPLGSITTRKVEYSGFPYLKQKV